MAVGENGNAVPQIKQEEEASSGLPRGPLPRRKQPSSASTGSHITSILARYTATSPRPQHCDEKQTDSVLD